MKNLRILAVVIFVVGLGMSSRAGQNKPSSNGRLTIEKLIDIRHPSNPVWSHDSKRVAFLWERAGVTDLYVVAVDGSAKPVAITTGRAAPASFS